MNTVFTIAPPAAPMIGIAWAAAFSETTTPKRAPIAAGMDGRNTYPAHAVLLGTLPSRSHHAGRRFHRGEGPAGKSGRQGVNLGPGSRADTQRPGMWWQPAEQGAEQQVNAMASLVERYYAVLDAPHKELIWFEQSGHPPLYSEASKVVDIMVNRVLAAPAP